MNLPRLTLLTLLTSLGGTGVQAEVFTLTDKQDRSIQADVLSVDGDKIRIKRTDGLLFDLSLTTLVEADQKKLRDWAAAEAAKPKVLPANAIEVMTSRTKFDSKKTETPETYRITYTDGTSETKTRTLVTTHEQWGYSITITNRTLQPITDLRAEYILFTGAAPRPQRTNISQMPIGTIVSRDRAVFKSGTTLLVKTSYKGEMGRPAGDTLYGIWLRIYHNNVLIHESSSPENLRQTGTW